MNPRHAIAAVCSALVVAVLLGGAPGVSMKAEALGPLPCCKGGGGPDAVVSVYISR